MYLRENPVLQRELLVNLRMPRAFLWLLIYQGLLGMLVYLDSTCRKVLKPPANSSIFFSSGNSFLRP